LSDIAATIPANTGYTQTHRQTHTHIYTHTRHNTRVVTESSLIMA